MQRCTKILARCLPPSAHFRTFASRSGADTSAVKSAVATSGLKAQREGPLGVLRPRHRRRARIARSTAITAPEMANRVHKIIGRNYTSALVSLNKLRRSLRILEYMRKRGERQPRLSNKALVVFKALVRRHPDEITASDVGAVCKVTRASSSALHGRTLWRWASTQPVLRSFMGAIVATGISTCCSANETAETLSWAETNLHSSAVSQVRIATAAQLASFGDLAASMAVLRVLLSTADFNASIGKRSHLALVRTLCACDHIAEAEAAVSTRLEFHKISSWAFLELIKDYRLSSDVSSMRRIHDLWIQYYQQQRSALKFSKRIVHHALENWQSVDRLDMVIRFIEDFDISAERITPRRLVFLLSESTSRRYLSSKAKRFGKAHSKRVAKLINLADDYMSKCLPSSRTRKLVIAIAVARFRTSGNSNELRQALHSITAALNPNSGQQTELNLIHSLLVEAFVTDLKAKSRRATRRMYAYLDKLLGRNAPFEYSPHLTVIGAGVSALVDNALFEAAIGVYSSVDWPQQNVLARDLLSKMVAAILRSQNVSMRPSSWNWLVNVLQQRENEDAVFAHLSAALTARISDTGRALDDALNKRVQQLTHQEKPVPVLCTYTKMLHQIAQRQKTQGATRSSRQLHSFATAILRQFRQLLNVSVAPPDIRFLTECFRCCDSRVFTTSDQVLYALQKAQQGDHAIRIDQHLANCALYTLAQQGLVNETWRLFESLRGAFGLGGDLVTLATIATAYLKLSRLRPEEYYLGDGTELTEPVSSVWWQVAGALPQLSTAESDQQVMVIARVVLLACRTESELGEVWSSVFRAGLGGQSEMAQLYDDQHNRLKHNKLL